MDANNFQHKKQGLIKVNPVYELSIAKKKGLKLKDYICTSNPDMKLLITFI